MKRVAINFFLFPLLMLFCTGCKTEGSDKYEAKESISDHRNGTCLLTL
jgi:hypothetical protein